HCASSRLGECTEHEVRALRLRMVRHIPNYRGALPWRQPLTSSRPTAGRLRASLLLLALLAVTLRLDDPAAARPRVAYAGPACRRHPACRCRFAGRRCRVWARVRWVGVGCCGVVRLSRLCGLAPVPCPRGWVPPRRCG